MRQEFQLFAPYNEKDNLRAQFICTYTHANFMVCNFHNLQIQFWMQNKYFKSGIATVAHAHNTKCPIKNFTSVEITSLKKLCRKRLRAQKNKLIHDINTGVHVYYCTCVFGDDDGYILLIVYWIMPCTQFTVKKTMPDILSSTVVEALQVLQR